MRPAWAKLARDDRSRWHSLIGHCSDVAAAFRALAERGATRERLSELAGRTLDERDMDRLAVVAMLHDVGKANAGFQARRDPRAPPIGHIMELGGVCEGEIARRFAETVYGPTLEAWLPDAETADRYFLAALSHHGAPVTGEDLAKTGSSSSRHWMPREDRDPLDDAAALVAAARAALPRAFERGDPSLPSTPAFIHAFAGLVQLADWIGSNEAWFPYDQGEPGAPGTRFAKSYPQAQRIVHDIGFVRPCGEAISDPIFGALFQRDGAPLEPRAIQSAISEADAAIVLLEAETGAGKTEAALLHFARLYTAGAVDALYFALPTRVAASQLHKRVEAFAARFFGPGARVLRAVPGDTSMAEAEQAMPLPDETFASDTRQWDAVQWAAERPKRFLAARIAVGTVDQALLAALRSRHAHMRAACLLRSLLVVDEVHASDIYMTQVLRQLLANHVAAGGRALLMSATLGGAAAAKLLSPRGNVALPKLADAITAPYPLIRAGLGRPIAIGREGVPKRVWIDPRPIIDEADAVAALAAEAARAGAKVLVVRNTVMAAQATFATLDTAHADAPVFALEGVRTLHHGRFALPDRRRLDAAVERALGRGRAPGGLVLIGTQTLEQSLDIDADLLITDLAPMDVLLQRIGRLHRHAETLRPPGFERPRVVVLMPPTLDFAGLAGRPVRGFGNMANPGKAVYPNLLILRATHDVLTEKCMLLIPDDNRALVERATHPEALKDLADALAKEAEEWQAHHNAVLGQDYARTGVAGQHSLDMTKPFGEQGFPKEETVLTRLGAADRLLPLPGVPLGPFGLPVAEITLPGHWAFVPHLPVETVAADIALLPGGGFAFVAGKERLIYDHLGLRRAR